MAARKPLIMLDGRLVRWEDAAIHPSTHAFLYGTAVFEGIRAYWNAAREELSVFELSAHAKRLARNARMLGMPNPPSPEDLAEQVLETLAVNAFTSDVYVRPIVFFGEGSIGVFPATQPTRTLVLATPLGSYFGKDALAAKVSSWMRISGRSIPPIAKVNGAYVNSYLATKEARDAGFDEAILLNERGLVSEGSAENLWIVRNRTLVTTGFEDDILDGITREFVKVLAADLGIPVVERGIPRAELYAADEAFFSGTGVEITPIAKVDHVVLGDGKPGPLTRRIRDRFRAAVRGEVSAHAQRLTLVPQACPIVTA